MMLGATSFCSSVTLIAYPKTDFNPQIFFFFSILLVNKALEVLDICRIQLQVAAAFLPSVLAIPDCLVSFQPLSSPKECILLTPGLLLHVDATGRDVEVGADLLFVQISHHSVCSELQFMVSRLAKAKELSQKSSFTSLPTSHCSQGI